MTKPVRNLAKPFAVGGLIVGEILMAFTVLAPNLQGTGPVPWDAVMMRLLVGAVFFGPFGAAAGTGVGLLATGLLARLPRNRKPHFLPPEPPAAKAASPLSQESSGSQS